MLARNQEEADRFKEESARGKFARDQARAAGKANRKERAILLQAKLIEMRTKLEAQT